MEHTIENLEDKEKKKMAWALTMALILGTLIGFFIGVL